MSYRLLCSSFAVLYAVLRLLAQAVIYLNLFLAFLNLIPIPPLDGSKVVMRFLPVKYYHSYLRLESYGFLILVILLVSGILSSLIQGLVAFIEELFLLIPKFLFNE